MSEKGRLERKAKREAREKEREARAKAEKEAQEQKENTLVVYYNTGTKCLIRLAVSLFTLRQHYTGPAIVILEGDHPEWIFHVFFELGIKCKRIQPDTDLPKRVKGPLTRKPEIPYFVPNAKNYIFLDSDTIVTDKIDNLFNLPDGKTFGVTAFSDWHEGGGMMSKRIKAFLPLTKTYKPHDGRPAVNTGVFCWKLGSKFVDPWLKTTREAAAHPEFGQSSTIMTDEIAAQVLLDRDDVHIFPSRFNESVKFGKAEDPAIIHFHGGKHLIDDAKHSGKWEAALQKCKEYFKGHVIEEAFRRDWGDSAYRNTLLDHKVADTTLVVAVDNTYLPYLQKAWPEWMKRQDLRSMPVQVFVGDKISLDDPRLDFLREANGARNEDGRPSVTWRTWNFDKHFGDHRSAMFAAYIHGVAWAVKTKYWIKIDADTIPSCPDPMFDRTDYKHDLVANPWGFTKVKNDPIKAPHWINRLDEWWFEDLGKAGLGQKFPNIKGDKHRHPRHISKISMERTKHTKELAKLLGYQDLGDDEAQFGVMMIPSQDTTVWYYHLRSGTNVKYKKLDYRSVRL